MSTPLPLAGQPAVRSWLWITATTHRGAFAAMMTLFVAATAAGLVGPALLGELVESVADGTMTPARVDLVALVFVGALVAAALLTRWARFVAAVFGERLLARAREDLVEQVVALPLDTVESAGTGELLSRATSDVDKLDEGLRQAAPEILVASVMVAATAVAMILTSPLLAVGMLVAVPVLALSTRWYRPRAIPNYERVLARWAAVHGSTHETVDGGRTVEALGLGPRRVAHHEGALRAVTEGELRAGWLWAWFLAGLEIAAVIPIAAMLLLGGWAYQRGLVGIGEITATVLYARALAEPLNDVLGWLDELQIGNAALRRILGVRELIPETRTGTTAATTPDGRRLVVRDVRFGYHPGREVLHGVDLDIAPGERLTVVGPSGAGKSTLGRLLAGVNAPDSGSVTIGGVAVSALPLAQRRREVALVTQEQHVFAATLRENLTLPRRASDDELWDALRVVGADAWARALPSGLAAAVGPGAAPVPPSTAAQLALARLVLADPHTLVLDEATSLLDGNPASSRELERSLAAVLTGRTVVAIAHRLDSARDADRVAVMVDGRIVELGSHDELVAAGGSYAQLWTTWSGAPGRPSNPHSLPTI